MHDITWTTLVSLSIPLLAIFVPVWPAMKARRLGHFQYRWGVYVAAETLVASVSFFLDAVRRFRDGSPWESAAFAVMGVLAMTASAGIFQRRRFGVTAFVLVFALSLILPSVYALLGYRLQGRITGEGIIVLVFLLVTVQYFRRRWTIMAPGEDAAPV